MLMRVRAMCCGGSNTSRSFVSLACQPPEGPEPVEVGGPDPSGGCGPPPPLTGDSAASARITSSVFVVGEYVTARFVGIVFFFISLYRC
jgi:hypothetical protein